MLRDRQWSVEIHTLLISLLSWAPGWWFQGAFEVCVKAPKGTQLIQKPTLYLAAASGSDKIEVIFVVVR